MNNDAAVILRKTTQEDLPILFSFQQDEAAIQLAAFSSKDGADEPAWLDRFTRLLSDPTVNNQTIVIGNTIAGSIAKFEIQGDAEITYWIDRKFWGQGVATAALKQLLTLENTRPLFGRAAFDNIPSQRVLEKCGFKKIGTDKGFANARQAIIEEFIYRLD